MTEHTDACRAKLLDVANHPPDTLPRDPVKSPDEEHIKLAAVRGVPLAVIYNFFLDRFIAGFTVGAIK